MRGDDVSPRLTLLAESATRTARTILWVDSLGGLFVGIIVLAFHSWFAEIEALPVRVVLLMAVANIAYGAYSGSLAVRRELPRQRAITFLVAANLTWTVVCALLLLRYGATATPFAWLHIGGEGLYVGVLALVEWRKVRPHARSR